jgi:hypothetical protein
MILFLRVDKRPLLRRADLYMVHLFLEANAALVSLVQPPYESALSLRQAANDDLKLRGVSLTTIYEISIQPLISSVRPMLGVHGIGRAPAPLAPSASRAGRSLVPRLAKSTPDGPAAARGAAARDGRRSFRNFPCWRVRDRRPDRGHDGWSGFASHATCARGPRLGVGVL